MRQAVIGLVTALALGSGAQAAPFAATFTGVLLGTQDPFTATFHYDTSDLTPSSGNGDYLEAASGTAEWASYSDPYRSLTFVPPASFSKGEYASTVYDETGAVAEIDTVHDYTIITGAGLLSLTFGGVNDMGLVTLDPDGINYLTLDPQSFSLVRDTVSPVPLPPSVALLAGALLAFGFVARFLPVSRADPRG